MQYFFRKDTVFFQKRYGNYQLKAIMRILRLAVAGDIQERRLLKK